MLATVPAAENDTLLQSCNQLELPPPTPKSEAAALPLRAEGLPLTLTRAGDDDEREPTTTTAARCCQTCGASIASHRKPETRYCGKQCRNAASNPRNNARRLLALVKSLVQRLNERAGWGLPLEGEKSLHIEAERVFQGFVGKVKLAVQVDVLPAHGRAGGDGIGHRLALGRRGLE